jgi:hypothetical protein
LAEWLAGIRLPLKREDEVQPQGLSPRRKGIRRAGKLMFFSAVLFPIFVMFSIAIDEGGPIVIPVILFFVSVAMMLYARLFSDNNPPAIKQTVAQSPTFGSAPARGSLTQATTTAIPTGGRQQVRTNELAQPPSVTEHTTRLLDHE